MQLCNCDPGLIPRQMVAEPIGFLRCCCVTLLLDYIAVKFSVMEHIGTYRTNNIMR